MKVRAVDKNHDWVFGGGLGSYKRESEAISQCVKTALLSVKNNWFLDVTHGIAWFEYWTKNPNVLRMEREVKQAILNVDGVLSITDFDIVIDSETRKCVISVSYRDKFNEENTVTENVG